MRKPSKGAVAAVAVSAALLAGTGTVGAYAAGMIGSADIKNNSVQSVDVKDGSLKARDMTPQTILKFSKPGPKGAQGPEGPAGPAGPMGPAGDSHITYIQNFDTVVNPVSAGDANGLAMTGEGAVFGPFANGGGCSTAGDDYARLQFHGLDGVKLSDISQLDFTGLTTSDNNTSGVGSLTMRITTDHAGSNGYPKNRFVFSPNTQAGPDMNADTRGQVKTYLTTLGSWRLNDDAGERPGDEAAWSNWVAQNGTEHVEKIDILLGCQAGDNLTGVVRSIQANGTTYQLGKIG